MAVRSITELFAKARACYKRGDIEEAIRHIRIVLQKEPSNAEAYNNLGLLLSESGSHESAVVSYEKSIVLNPSYAEVYCNCANALLSSGALPGATRYFEKALSLKGDLYEALLGLGAAKQAAGDLDTARGIFCECLRRRPDDGVAHFRLGNIMREWNRLDLAAGCFKNTLRCMPGHTLALMNLGEALQSAGQIDESEKIFSATVALEPHHHLAYSNLFISMNYNPSYSSQQVFDAHARWGAAIEGRFRGPNKFLNGPDPDRMLKIGFVSSDFSMHPAASFLMPVIRNLDRRKFTILCYSTGKNRDAKTEDFKGCATIWRELSECSDEDAERIITGDLGDILIDCTGHMADNRLPLFARRLAPIQVAWIGYPNTTGLTSMDYRFTDAIVDPLSASATALYTETLIRLPNGFCAWEPPDNAPGTASLPAIRNGFITFGSLHTLSRLNENVLSLWSRVLSAVPGSRLLIFRNTLNDEIIRRLSSWFSRNSVDMKRVDFKKEVPIAGHLSVYQDIDIALDTFPWSGHTTACEALWMGVPVITLSGDRAAGRMVASVLTHAGMGEWIADTQERYIEMAWVFSRDQEKLAAIRNGLRNTMRLSVLCDGKQCAIDAGEALRKMWARWCSSAKRNTNRP